MMLMYVLMLMCVYMHVNIFMYKQLTNKTVHSIEQSENLAVRKGHYIHARLPHGTMSVKPDQIKCLRKGKRRCAVYANDSIEAQ